jgi:hypothetical protein
MRVFDRHASGKARQSREPDARMRRRIWIDEKHTHWRRQSLLYESLIQVKHRLDVFIDRLIACFEARRSAEITNMNNGVRYLIVFCFQLLNECVVIRLPGKVDPEFARSESRRRQPGPFVRSRRFSNLLSMDQAESGRDSRSATVEWSRFRDVTAFRPVTRLHGNSVLELSGARQFRPDPPA